MGLFEMWLWLPLCDSIALSNKMMHAAKARAKQIGIESAGDGRDGEEKRILLRVCGVSNYDAICHVWLAFKWCWIEKNRFHWLNQPCVCCFFLYSAHLVKKACNFGYRHSVRHPNKHTELAVKVRLAKLNALHVILSEKCKICHELFNLLTYIDNGEFWWRRRRQRRSNAFAVPTNQIHGE